MLAPLAVLLAEGDPLSGSPGGWSGWAGAGLLGLVLCWLLLKHLPDKDKQIEERDKTHQSNLLSQSQRHDMALLAQSDRHEKAIKEAREAYEKDLQLIVDHCKAEMAMMTESVGRQMGELMVELRFAIDDMSGKPRRPEK